MSWLGDLALPQGQGFQWLVEDDEFTSHSQKLSSTQILLERYALAVLYYATSGPNWPIEYSFLDGTTSACEWNNGGRPGEEEADGIYCTDSTQFGIVTFLRLHEGEQLAGSLPTEVGLLSSLQHISLDGNALTGTLPSEIGNLSGLQKMDLEANRLTGIIPTEIGLLSTVEHLYLEKNELSGTLPSEIGNLSSLQTFYIYGNPGITGTVPSEFEGLQSLESFSFENTTLSGSVDAIFCPIYEGESLSLYGDCLGLNPEIECSCCAICCEPDGENCEYMIYAAKVTSGGMSVPVMGTTTLVLFHLLLVWLPLALIL
eukprot:Nitzschia sp. Nitz4//scaffold187_size43274//12046//14055//NITZ4_007332-RA/size43274-exonerate_protein2genome-gene-0.19-mRNA-1//1//CDS//3329539804//6020//frame0